MTQTSAFPPELGNAPEHILKILHHMADHGSIENKVNIPVGLLKCAKQNGYDFEAERLDISLAPA